LGGGWGGLGWFVGGFGEKRVGFCMCLKKVRKVLVFYRYGGGGAQGLRLGEGGCGGPGGGGWGCGGLLQD